MCVVRECVARREGDTCRGMFCIARCDRMEKAVVHIGGNVEFFFLIIRRSLCFVPLYSSAASDVYK